MAVLIEAKGSKRDGTTYFPYELGKQRMPVEVVDRRWRNQHWNEIKRIIGRVENARLKSLLHLKEAVDGKSSDPKTEAGAVIAASEPFQKLMDEVATEYAEGGFQSASPGARIVAWKHAIPEYAPPTGPADKTIVWKDKHPVEQASDFILSLKREPRALAAAELSLGLSRAKPCVWLDKKEQRQFGLFCPDLLSAIYANAVLGFGIAACLRCGQVFERDRADRQFCSPRCQNTYLTAKRRRRKRDLSAGRKHPKHQVRRIARKRRQQAA